MARSPTRYSVQSGIEKLDRKLEHEHELLHNIKERLEAMSTELDRLTTEVAEIKTVTKSAAALLRRLATIIRDNANNPAALTALADELNAEEQDLAAAVVESTPAEEENPETPTSDDPDA